ncbi:MAG: exodeoxyribonuclease VII large subunit [Thermoplasmata archaeon]
MEQPKIYTVTELCSRIKEHLKGEPELRNIYIRGEISNLAISQERAYFALKDAVSKINVVMFSLPPGAEQQLKEGITVVVHGKIDFYQRDGKLNLIADIFYPVGQGDVYLKLEMLKEKLKAEGIFALEAKRKIPKYIFSVGIATSLQGAVVHDILHALAMSRGMEIFVIDTQVQGEGAKESIVKSIEILNNLNVDVIILARGGGSIEDLWAFNEEIVVRAVRNSKIPVITAIGHETDITLSCLASDLNLPTPSYAGKFLLERYQENLKETEELMRALNEAATEYIQELVTALDFLSTRISPLEFQRLIKNQMEKIELLEKLLKNTVQSAINDRKMWLAKLESLLALQHPEEILKLGYAYITKEEMVVTKGIELHEGELIEIHFWDAVVHAQVQGREVKEWKKEEVLKKN